MKHEASCTCGQLSLIYEGQITKTSICHCFACQKRTGSVFGVQVRLEKDLVSLHGQPQKYLRVGDEGSRTTSYFCGVCGSTLYWEVDLFPNSYVAAVGAFADPQLAAPTFSVYEARKHHWVQLPNSIVDHMD